MTAGDPVEAARGALLREGVVLCVRLGEEAPLAGACRGALAGGLRALELTLTTPGALAAMESFAAEPDALVGAGTVLTREEVRSVASAGGRFVMSPVFDAEVVDQAHGLGLLAIPGAATPREVLTAHRHGARLVKLFPAGPLGGPAYVRAIRGPLPDVPLLPTGGPTAENLAAYLAAGAVAVGIGAEVFAGGLEPARVEAGARRVRAAFAAARLGEGGAAEARVTVTPVPVAGHVVQGVTCAWQGGQYVTLVAPRGMVACGIFDPAVCETFDFAVAMARGTPEAPLVEPRDVLGAVVDTVSSRARALGIEPGMHGEAALARLLAGGDESLGRQGEDPPGPR